MAVAKDQGWRYNKQMHLKTVTLVKFASVLTVNTGRLRIGIVSVGGSGERQTRRCEGNMRKQGRECEY